MAIKTNNYVKKTGDTMSGSLNMGSHGTGQTIMMNAVDGTNEGGEINFDGAGTNQGWLMDVYQNTLRFLSTIGLKSVSIDGTSGNVIASGTITSTGLVMSAASGDIIKTTDDGQTRLESTNTIYAGADIILRGGDYAGANAGNMYLSCGDIRAGKAPDSSIGFFYRTDGTAPQIFKIYKTGCLAVASVADASAPNSTLYFSSTANKLVWKDAGGTVNALY